MLNSVNGSNLIYEIDDSLVKNSREAGFYLNKIKEVNVLPFPNIQIFFSSDVWDFSSTRNVNIKKSDLKFQFGTICEQFRDELKKYVLFLLLDENMKIQVIHNNFLIVGRLFNYAFDMSYYNISQFDTSLLSGFMQKFENLSKAYQGICAKTIRSFLLYYSMHYEDIMTPEIETLLNYRKYLLNKEEKERRKTPDIPQYYYDAFLKASIEIVDSDDVPLHIRAATCILLILSQTGLRISEILDLRCGSLCKVISYNGTELFYLNYRTWKRERGNNVFTVEKVFANVLVKKAYELLMGLYRNERLQFKSEYLYLGNLQRQASLNFPVSKDRFGYTQKEVWAYMNKYFSTVNLPKEKQLNLSTCKVAAFTFLKSYCDYAETLTYPTTAQFRVHVCSELYARGCPLEYIQKFMGHLSNEMMGYYVRTNPHNSQEDIKYAQDIFKKIVSGDARLLGNNSDSLKSRIDTFIHENRYKIEKDMDTIIVALTDKMPVRQKTGGVCIRSSSVRECSKDAMTNEFYCAYGVCGNIFHFFYMSDVSYRQASELWESINSNLKRGFKRQAYKESLMLHTLVNQKLIPELDELKTEIIKKGNAPLIEKYPDLEHIILNLNNIYTEAKTWKDYNI